MLCSVGSRPLTLAQCLVAISRSKNHGKSANSCARHLCTDPGQGACPDAGLRRDDPYPFLSELSGPSIGVDVLSILPDITAQQSNR